MADNLLHVDPQQQRAFIEQLNSRTRSIENVIEILESRLRLLGRDWQDAEYVEFSRQARKTAIVLKQFIEEGRKVAREIARAADLGEKYQSIRN
ncbi:hypothetical protein DFR48_1189 [Ciceribacter lividus]|uniref:WXG100 family type VII secretion target n=1 Tax=Ciceribacter lividus TaxID=1197950 RepID=A0A6I7HH58_9HYPH|nr:hypothetical protein [Ciceribacter lividus]RCW19804.1 hypothetical protein DFR48_1189 [Ciceribacter lividus]